MAQVESSEHLELISSLPTWDPIFARVVERFADRLNQRLPLMYQALWNHNYEQLTTVADWLARAGNAAGFDAFCEPAKAIGQLVDSGRLGEIDALLEEIGLLATSIVLPVPTYV
jgi:hypothetical protein